MSRLATLYLPELNLEKFDQLKDGSHSCLTQSNPQESVNLQSIKNRIHNMIFSHCVQDSKNMTFWRLGGINLKVFPELCPNKPHREAYSALQILQL